MRKNEIGSRKSFNMVINPMASSSPKKNLTTVVHFLLKLMSVLINLIDFSCVEINPDQSYMIHIYEDSKKHIVKVML